MWRYDENDGVMKNFFIPIFMNFDKLNINYELIVSQISKNGLKNPPAPSLRNIKIHIIGPSPWLRDNKIWALTHTHDNGTIGCAFSPWTRWYKNCDATLKMTELWRFENFFIHIFMNFDELNINYELILSKISKNGIKTHAPPWLRNIKIHIIGPGINNLSVWNVFLHNYVTVMHIH